jgi:hypothetical protein
MPEKTLIPSLQRPLVCWPNSPSLAVQKYVFHHSKVRSSAGTGLFAFYTQYSNIPSFHRSMGSDSRSEALFSSFSEILISLRQEPQVCRGQNPTQIPRSGWKRLYIDATDAAHLKVDRNILSSAHQLRGDLPEGW